MKKKIFLAIIFFVCMTNIVLADWSVTVNWISSPGPNLINEKVMLDGIEQCTIGLGDQSTCTFIVTSLTGQEVIIRSFNEQGAYSDYIPGTLVEMLSPNPASGAVITITIVP